MLNKNGFVDKIIMVELHDRRNHISSVTITLTLSLISLKHTYKKLNPNPNPKTETFLKTGE